ANGFVFVGGTIADDTSASIGEQTRNILGKIAGYLKEAGTDATCVVSASIFVTDLSSWPRCKSSPSVASVSEAEGSRRALTRPVRDRSSHIANSATTMA